MTSFVSKPIVAEGEHFDVAAMSRGEPSLPPSFTYGDDRLVVATLVRTWKGYKEDRGDTYVKRHYFEFVTTDGRTATVYFDRGAKRGAPRWYLFSIKS